MKEFISISSSDEGTDPPISQENQNFYLKKKSTLTNNQNSHQINKILISQRNYHHSLTQESQNCLKNPNIQVLDQNSRQHYKNPKPSEGPYPNFSKKVIDLHDEVEDSSRKKLSKRLSNKNYISLENSPIPDHNRSISLESMTSQEQAQATSRESYSNIINESMK